MFLGAAAALATVCLAQGQTDEQLFRLGERARKEDRSGEALTAFKALLERKPDHLEGHLGYQKLLQSQKKEAVLVGEYKAFLERRGEAWCHYLYGRLLRDPKKEEELFRKGLALDPKSFELRLALADALRRDLRREEAVREYRKALPDRPDALREHLAYIKLMRDLGRPAEVLGEYSKRLERTPEDFRSYLLYASALITFGIDAQTKELLDRALELSPGNQHVLGALGVYYAKSKDIPKAQKALEEALRADPYHPGTLYQQGVVLLFLADDDRGFEPLRAAARLEPDSSKIFSDLGAAYLTRKKADLAEENLKESLRLDPTNDWSAHRMGLLAWIREDYARAIEWQGRAIALCPFIAEYHAALGRAYERIGESVKAKVAHEKAEALRRKRP